MTNLYFLFKIRNAFLILRKGAYKFVSQKKEKITQAGIVIENLPNTTFKVKLDDGREVLAHLSGKMRLNFIRILLGDRVQVELSPYDETRGRIVYRNK